MYQRNERDKNLKTLTLILGMMLSLFTSISYAQTCEECMAKCPHMNRDFLPCDRGCPKVCSTFQLAQLYMETKENLTYATKNKACLSNAIGTAAKEFAGEILEVTHGPKITVEYLNRNIYFIDFEYILKGNQNPTTMRYIAFSDYSENFVPMNACKIKQVSKIEKAPGTN
jgi:hypothetical protein